jgi:hypothetical protein
MGPSTFQLGDRTLELRLSPTAAWALREQRDRLDIEMELYFSCLVAKRVYFRSAGRPDVAARAQLTDSVSVSFRPVVTESCWVRDVDAAPEVEMLSMVRTAPFTPRWLALDYVHGCWSGRFGF